MQIAIYLRQSRDDKDNRLAISRQLDACLALCKERAAAAKPAAEKHMWENPEVYCDNNTSASSRSVVRKDYRRMIANIEAGRLGGIATYQLDRLYRQPRELEDLIDLADERQLKLATATGEVDLATDAGRLHARIMGNVAKFEGERKGNRQKLANAQAARDGKWQVQSRPFGYELDGTLRQPEATLLGAAYRNVLDNKSLWSIVALFNKYGMATPRGKRWSTRNLRRTLLNPRYAALRVHQGRVVNENGKWTAVVDKDTYEGVAAILSDPERVVCTTWERTYMGVGTYRCGRCGGTMKTHYQKDKKSRSVRRTYVCKAAGHLGRQADALDDHVANVILERLSNAELIIKPPTVDIPALQDRRAALQARKDKLLSMFKREIIDGQDYEDGAADLKAKIGVIDGRLAEAKRTSPAAAMVASGEDLRAQWEQMSASIRSQVIDELAVVTILPSPCGRKCFDPAYVDIAWK
ncbi:recombinase family protein [Mycobacterium sp.]|uniref:recombinase family protein n=1 Tax=Mycobacterium sp. TaxID=1785 RepID=UPI002C1653D0|nr:recombinase family protein [Mycobacterium sp.]HME46671.1 recombinase family protein [Mycobacterium sp.]